MSEEPAGDGADEAAPFVPSRSASGDDDPGAADLEHLPPPVFPSGSSGPRGDAGGSARSGARSATRDGDGAVATEGAFPDDALIDPEEPIASHGSPFSDDAFIDPDEPIVRTHPPEKPADFEEVVRGRNDGEEDEVVVTGIGESPPLDEMDHLSAMEQYDDPHVARLVRMVGTLADALRDRGEAGLRTTSDMTRFEATLRGYCVGYLAGARRDED